MYDFNILERRAKELIAFGRPKDAMAIYLFMADGDPSLDAGCLGMRVGECFELLGELHAAKWWYGRAVEENPEIPAYVEARRRLAGVNIEHLLTAADHEAEDADDIAMYDARKAELAVGGLVLPPEVSAAVLRGESRLKAIRNWRGETQLHLNFKTGIGQGYLSDLESGRRTGTPETIAKLAQALDVPVEWLS